jgi:hypothetical protein
MAEIELFANHNEILDMMKIFLEAKSMRRLTDESEIAVLSEVSSLFFIVKEDLMESPLQFREVTTPEKHFYYISPRVGGPSLQFYWGGAPKQSDKPQLAASMLSYYPWYEDSVTGVHKKPSKAFIEMYSICAKKIRSSRRRIKPGVRAYWISPQVEQLVRAGTSLIGLEKFSDGEILNGAHDKR